MLLLTIIGALGLFLFGMKLLSEALQRLTGRSIRSTMQAFMRTAWLRICSGFVVTAAVQSSSAVTVMIVSFANAGLVNLRQAFGLVMGANIGTTITAWLICIFGFGLNIGNIAIPLAGLGFALILIQKRVYRVAGSLIMGVALLFLGLQIMQTSLGQIMTDSWIEQTLERYSDMGYASIVLFVLLGTLITSIIQSSSAMIVLTMVMCQRGWIPVEAGAALILGENLGTTITANLAAVMSNTAGRRVALSHTLFNLFGVLWMLPVLPWVMDFIEWAFGYNSTMTGSGAAGIAVPFMLATFHSLFNIANVALLSGFTTQIIGLVSKIIPTPKAKEKGARLKVLESGILSTPELSLVQASAEIINHAKRTLKMFGFVRTLARETENSEFERIYARIEKYERLTDAVEREIIAYLSEVSRGDMSSSAISSIQTMFRTMSYIENIANTNLAIAKILKRKRDAGIWFNQDLRDKFMGVLDLVEQALYLMVTYLERPDTVKLEKLQTLERNIDDRYVTLREEQLSDVSQHEYPYVSAVLFCELIKECDKLAGSTMSIANASKPAL